MLAVKRLGFLSATLLAALLRGGTSFAGPPAPPPKPPATVPRDAADDWFDRGTAAYAAHKLAEAEAAFTEAWKLKKTQDIAANLGTVELELGKARRAAEHLRYAVEHAAPTDSDAARAAARRRYERARAQVGALRVVVNLPGAHVFLNDELVGHSPIESEVFADPGTASLSARLDGYKVARAVVQVEKGQAQGQAQEVLLKLEPVETPRRSVIPGAVLGGVAGAALVTGIGLFAGGRGKASSARDLHDAILKAGVGCVSGAAHQDARCADLYSTTSTGNTLQKAGVGLMIGAGAAAVGTVIYFMLPAPRASSAPGVSLRIAPTLAPNDAGIILSGTF